MGKGQDVTMAKTHFTQFNHTHFQVRMARAQYPRIVRKRRSNRRNSRVITEHRQRHQRHSHSHRHYSRAWWRYRLRHKCQRS